MKKNLFIAALAALALSLTACQKDEFTGSDITPDARVKTTADLHNTNWEYSLSAADLLTALMGSDFSDVECVEGDTYTIGLNFDGTHAHFSFSDNIEAYMDDQQIFGISYEYSYNGATHTGYLVGTAEDENGNEVPAQLQFTYNDATDVITFELPLQLPESNVPFLFTMNFARN